MSELTVIESTRQPVTRADLVRALQEAEISGGEILLAHISLSAIGWVCGGPVTVIQALVEALGPSGTLVIPAFSADISDPSDWSNPPVPQAWWPSIRESMPAYQPRITPTLGVGRTAEVFRCWPKVKRSAHPVHSFAALGPSASALLKKHSLNNGLGNLSPLGRLYDLNAKVLLLGCGYANNSCFHLAEYRVPGGKPILCRAPIMKHGARCWVEYEDLELDDSQFEAIGRDFEDRHGITRRTIGCATTCLFSIREAVDFAVNWLRNKRQKHQ